MHKTIAALAGLLAGATLTVMTTSPPAPGAYAEQPDVFLHNASAVALEGRPIR